MRELLGSCVLCLFVATPVLAQSALWPGSTRTFDDDLRNSIRAVPDNNVQYAGRLAGTSGTLRYYGSDAGGPSFDNSVDYHFEVVGTVQRLQFTRGNSPVYAGVHYMLTATRSQFAEDVLPPGVQERDLRTHLGGVGASVGYDSRTDPRDSRIMTFLANATWFDHILGSSAAFGKLELAGTMSARPANKWSVGARFDARSAWGDVPFFDTPYLAMRGLPARQYANDVVVLTEAEAHRVLNRRWSAVAFGGVGRVAKAWGELTDAPATGAAGVGVRYLVVVETGMRAGFDVARTPDGSVAFYFQSGAAWP